MRKNAGLVTSAVPVVLREAVVDDEADGEGREGGEGQVVEGERGARVHHLAGEARAQGEPSGRCKWGSRQGEERRGEACVE